MVVLRALPELAWGGSIQTRNTHTRLIRYLEGIRSKLRDRRQWSTFCLYASGLLSSAERKSLASIASRASTSAAELSAVHHQLIHFIGSSPWRDAPVRQYAAQHAAAAMLREGPIQAWIVDDIVFLKQGSHSPGVERQAPDPDARPINCQIAVGLVLANGVGHMTADLSLYLPESWTEQPQRRRRAHIPATLTHTPRWQLALDMIQRGLKADLPPGVIVAHSPYGDEPEFRLALREMQLPYVLGIGPRTLVKRVDKWGAQGALPVESLGRALAPELSVHPASGSRFASARVLLEQPGVQDDRAHWLLVEWPKGALEPSRFAMSSLAESTSLERLVQSFLAADRAQRCYEELNADVGLDQYEGRSFRGWHHHVTVALAGHAFLVSEAMRARGTKAH